MSGGKRALLATVALAVTGCTADDGKLNVRAIADPLSAAARRGSPMLAEGRGALALGNVGTALEAFRKALRQQPDSVEALAGIAACYERMGRYDLSRVNYEAALAIAPNNPVLLNTFAASLEHQGRYADAAALRAEAAQVDAAEVASTVRMAQADIAPNVTSVAPLAPSVPEMVAAAPPRTAVATRPSPERTAPPMPARQAPAVHTEVVGNTEWTIEIPQAQSAGSVTVPLPPLQAVELATIASERKAPSIVPAPRAVALVPPTSIAPKAAPTAIAHSDPAQPRPAAPPAPPRESSAVAVALAGPKAQAVQPRLQRLSMGEVALLTRNGPAWRTELVARTQHSVTARFVPLKGASAANHELRFVPLRTAMAANRPNVRLLNAARRQGLAARTRETLLDRGWRKIAIGDAAQIRARSIVLYPVGRQALGKRLAGQFGFASAINRQSDEVLVLLGRDAGSLSIRRVRG